MRRTLQNRILELGRGEEGVALVVTLAVFMFMYIFCAGVFAVGKMVKDRICLQNAADAAAYSAAVVQADTLSRIATINRAMSWTYAQMNKRRMDFIIYRWMEHAKQHYADDRGEATEWIAQNSQPSHRHYSKHVPYHDSIEFSAIHSPAISSDWSAIDHSSLKMGPSKVENKIASELSYYDKYITYDTKFGEKNRVANSFYVQSNARSGIVKLEQQIDADMKAITAMKEKEVSLIGNMRDHMRTAAYGILRANVPGFTNCAYVVKADSGYGNGGFLRSMDNTSDCESEFLTWGNEDEGLDTDELNICFGTGSGSWFVPERTHKPLGNRPGFLWQYEDTLECNWTWTAWYCKECRFTIDRLTHAKTFLNNPRKVYIASGIGRYRCAHTRKERECAHTRKERDPSCFSQLVGKIKCSVKGSVLYRKGYGWILDGYKSEKENALYRKEEDYIRAYPLVLKRNFFGSENPDLQNGTITVGVARPNDNPWRSVLGKALSNIGLYHAFDPYLDWMVCFASARAGYKLWEDVPGYEMNRYNQKPRVYRDERDYCIDWKDPQKVIRRLRRVWDFRLKKYVRRPVWITPAWRQSWNLRQSDWDAVMIPVCRAASGAEERTDHARTYGDFREPCWGATDGNYLDNLVKNGKWIFPEDRASNVGAWYAFSAGPDKPLSISDYGYINYEPGDLGGLLNKLPENYQGWQSNRGLRGKASVIKWPYRWRVSAPGARLNWVELQKEMLH